MKELSFSKYLKKHLGANNWEEVVKLFTQQKAYRNNWTFEIADDNDAVYTVGSDSVQLLHTFRGDIWRIEVFPVDPNKSIKVFEFSDEANATEAFKTWITYMDTVVFEQFKNF